MAENMGMLIVTSTSTGRQLGSIRLVDGKAVFEGIAEQIFRSRQRADGDLSDEDVYNDYADGWSNGALAIVPADGELPVEVVDADLSLAESAADAVQVAAELAGAVTTFVSAWPALAKPLVAGVVSDVRDAVRVGGVGGLASLTVGTAALATSLGKAMRSLAGRAAKSAAAEVSALGVKASAGKPDGDALQGQADVTAHLVGQTLVGSATRTGLLHAGRAADDVAAAVEADLRDLVDLKPGGYILQNLESALAGAQAAGRMATFATVEDKIRLQAVEDNDSTRCQACADADQTVYESFAAAADAYPAGKNRSCAGAGRCRGYLRPVKRTK